MHVGLERLDLRIPGCTSLKQKRHVVRSLTAALRRKFNVSVAEVGHQDLWQRAEIGVAMVSEEQYQVKKIAHEVERFVDVWGEVEVIDTDLTLFAPDG
jgi:uncharacterized protein YlxP (DUF503 family)